MGGVSFQKSFQVCAVNHIGIAQILGIKVEIAGVRQFDRLTGEQAAVEVYENALGKLAGTAPILILMSNFVQMQLRRNRGSVDAVFGEECRYTEQGNVIIGDFGCVIAPGGFLSFFLMLGQHRTEKILAELPEM